MKSIIGWSKTVGLTLGITGSILLSSFAGGLQALALTAQQVMERLRPVPVFTLTDQEGAPLVVTQQEGQNANQVAGIFIRREDAQAFLDRLKQSNPQEAQNLSISIVSLADAVNLAQAGAAANNSNERLRVTYIPAQQQVEAAKAVMQQNGQNAAEFQGVPLFIAQAQGDEGTYLIVRQGEQEVIPLFFNRDQLQAMLDRLKRDQPDLANNVRIRVVPLEGVIHTLQTSDNAELNRIVLVPPRDTIEFLRSIEPQQGQGQGQGQGQAGQQQQQNPRNRNQNGQRPQQQRQQNQQQQQQQRQ